MKAVLICPAERAAVESLARTTPLANATVLGRPVVVHWLEHLVSHGVKEVRILAADRPEQIRATVGDGSRWGLQIDVLPELRELTPAEARAKYCQPGSPGWLAEPEDVTLMDRLPGLPEFPLFDSYKSWFAAVRAGLEKFAGVNYLGVRELAPGIWIGPRARISPSAELRAPCWIGANATIGDHAIVGPRAVIEDRAVVEWSVEVSDSHVAPETFLGELLELKRSIGHGSRLINWGNASCITVPDAFLMCSLSEHRRRRASAAWFGRLVALLAMVLTLPFALIPFLKAKLLRQNSLRSLVAIRPKVVEAAEATGPLIYYELAQCPGCLGWLRRWPQLWKIIRGDFTWVGNPPLSPLEAASLANDFEKLWLDAPIGIVSLAQAEGITDPHGDEARACASFYAVQASWRLDLSILARVVLGPEKGAVTAAVRFTAKSARQGSADIQSAIEKLALDPPTRREPGLEP